MQFEEFEILIKDGLSKLYDYTLLESNPLVSEIIKPDRNFPESKGKFFKSVLSEAIETLKPVDKEYDLNIPEWRTYFVLKKRYGEGLNSLEVARLLSISERQFRRYLKRAINSISLRLWDRFQPDKSLQQSESIEVNASQSFSINWESVDLFKIIRGVLDLLSQRLDEEHTALEVQEPQTPVMVKSDRIILRQILIGFMNHLMHQGINNLSLSMDRNDPEKSLLVCAGSSKYESYSMNEADTAIENNLLYWSEILNIRLEEKFLNDVNKIEIRLRFIEQEQKTVMVVDDQEPALRMFTRYLSRTNLKIVGISKGTKVLLKARELQPALILLDIMMPKMDGWEVLQSLKLDETTRHIPVIVCSAWGEPELARSLGAVEFLRKPVRQKDLLATIARIGILN